MSLPTPLFAVLPILLLCALAQGRRQGARRPEWWGGLARIGFGLAKIVLLALPLERMVDGAIDATPQSQSLISAWMGCLGFSFQLYFALSGAVDLLLGVRKLLGRPCSESFQDPFLAGSFTAFWQSWNASLMQAYGRGKKAGNPTRNNAFLHAALSACVVLLCVILWRGASLATLVWAGIQMLLLSLEWWRCGRGLFMPLPLPIRAALTVAVIVLSNMLLYLPGLPEAWAEMRRLFVAPATTVYSVMLDARVTTPWPKYCLWLAMLLSAAGRPLRWLLSQSKVAAPLVGIPLGLLACGMLLKDREITDSGSVLARLRHFLQRPLTLAFQEGNERVFVGRKEWLFSQAELDRLTRRREAAPFSDALVGLATQLQSSKAPLLVVVVPDKAALYPQHILPAEYSAPVQPPGFLAALERLRTAGATVLDATDRLWTVRKKVPLYFKHDSHWTPEAMKQAALLAAKLIRQKWPQVIIDETPLINATILDRSDAGDLAHDLDPWAPDSLFGKETTQLISIRGLESSTERSPILVLGGNLIDVFHDPGLSFGNAKGEPQFAGFVTQLAALLGRPLDRRAVNEAAGSQAFRLWIEAASQKKLVICVVRAGDL